MSLSLGELLVDLRLNTEDYDRSLAEARQAAIAAGREIERGLRSNLPALTLTPRVDHSELAALNKHLDRKQQHFKEVQGYFDRNSLTPRADLSQLKEMERQLERLRRPVVQVAVQPTASGSEGGSSGGMQSVERVSRELELERSITRAIESGFKQASSGNLVGGLFKGITGAAGAVVNATIGNLLTGAVGGIGFEISRELAQGLSRGINREMSFIVGSFDLLGEQIGADLIKGILGALGRDGVAIENALKEILGPANIAREGAAVRGRQGAQRRETRQTAETQAIAEYRFVEANRGELAKRRDDLLRQRDRLAKNVELVNLQVTQLANNMGLDKLNDLAENLRQQIEEAGQQISTAVTSGNVSQERLLSVKVRALIGRLNQTSDAIEDIQRRAQEQFRSKIDAISQIDEELIVQERSLAQLLSGLESVDLLKIPQSRLVQKQRGAAPDIYKTIAQRTADLSGVQIRAADLPALVPDSNISSDAVGAYDRLRNVINVSPQTLEAAQQGSLNLRQVETLMHELRHAMQRDFGRMPGDESAVDLISPTFGERRKLGARIHQSSKGRSREARSLEADAYTFADRNAGAVFQEVQRSQALERLDATIGIGGGRLESEILTLQLKVAQIIKEVGDRFSKADVSTEARAAIEQIKQRGNEFSKVLDGLINVEALPADEIQAMQERVLEQYRSAIEDIRQYARNFAQQVEQIGQGVVQPAAPQGGAAPAPISFETLTEVPLPYMPKQVDLQAQKASSAIGKAAIDLGKISPESALEEAEKFAQNFWKAYKTLNTALESQDFASAERLLAVIQELSVKAKGEITEFAQSLGEQAAMGSPLGDRMNNRKSQISRATNLANANFQKAQRSRPSVDLESDLWEAQEDLRSTVAALNAATPQIAVTATQASTSIKGLMHELDQLAAQAVEAAESGDIPNPDELLNSLDDIRAKVSAYLQNLFSGTDGVDAEVSAAQAEANAAKNLNEFSRAEQEINRRYERSTQGLTQELEGGTDGILTRIINIIRASEPLKEIGDRIQRLDELTGGLLTRFSALAKAALAITVVAAIAPTLIEVANAAFEAAVQMQQFELVINFTAGSAAKGAESLKTIRAEVQRLGTDLPLAIAGFAKLSAAAVDTPLEGAVTRQGFESLNQAISVYQLSQREAERIYTAVEQMISKNKISSEELRQQMGDALPGSVQIFARANGVTTTQLDKMLEQGQILSESALPKFFQQIAAETAIAVPEAIKSSQAALNRFTNTIFELQAAVGKGLMPARNVALEVLTAGLKTLESVLPSVIQLLSSAAIAALLKFSGAMNLVALASIPNLLKALDFAKASLMGLINLLRSPLTGTLGLTAALFAAIELFKTFKIVSDDGGGAARDFAEQATKGLEKYNARLREAIDGTKELKNGLFNGTSTLEQNFIGQLLGGAGQLIGGREGREFTLRQLRGYERSTQELFNLPTLAQKQANDISVAVSEGVQAARSAIEQANNLLSDQRIMGNLNQLRMIDIAIRGNEAQRAALMPDDQAGRRSLDAERQRLLERRQSVAESVSSLQGLIASLPKQLEASLQVVQDALDQGGLPAEEEQRLRSRYSELKKAIADVQNTQDKLNASIGDGTNELAMFTRGLQGIADQIQDSGAQMQLLRSRQLAAVAQSQLANPLPQGQAESQRMLVEQQLLNEQIARNGQLITQLRSQLGDKNLQEALTTARVSLSSPAAIRTRAQDFTEGSQIRRQLDLAAEYAGQLQQLEVDTADLQQQLAEQQLQAAQQLRELSKEVSDFFRSIQRNAEELALSVRQSELDIALNRSKARLQQALSGFSNRFFGDFTDGLIGLLEQLFEPLQNALNAQQQVMQSRQQLEDLLLQADRLQQQSTVLPGAAPSMLSSATPFTGVQVTSARDASGEPGFDYVVSGGQRGAAVGSLVNGIVVEAIANQRQEFHREAGDTRRGYGNRVIVRTIDEVTGQFVDALIAHLDDVAVTVGQRVRVGTILGTQGRTGSTTGPHVSVDFFGPGSARTTDAALAMRDRLAAQLQQRGAASVANGLLPGAGSSGSGPTMPSAVNRYLNRLAFLESTFNAQADNGIARGAFQFTAPTAQDAVDAGIGDPRTGTLIEQALKAWRFIQRFHPQAVQTIETGDFAQADRLLNRRWVSLPGGAESAQSPDRIRTAAGILRGNGLRFDLPGSGGAATSVAPMAGAVIPSSELDWAIALGQANADTEARLAQSTLTSQNDLAAVQIRQSIVRLGRSLEVGTRELQQSIRQYARRREDLLGELSDDTPTRQFQSSLRQLSRDFEDANQELSDLVQEATDGLADLQNTRAQLAQDAQRFPELTELLPGIDRAIAEGQMQLFGLRKLFEQEQELREQRTRNLIRESQRQKESIRLESATQLFQSRSNIVQERISGLNALGFESQSRELQQQMAIAQADLDLGTQIRQIDEMVRTGQLLADTAQKIKNNLSELNQLRLDNIEQQFSIVGQLLPGLQSSFQGLFSGILTGADSLEKVLASFFSSIANNLAQLASQLIVNELFGSLLGVATGGGAIATGGGSKFGKLGLGFLGGLLGFSEGGVVPVANMGLLREGDDAIAQALRREGPNSILAALTPGELILTQRQTQRFFDLGLSSEVLNFRDGGIVGGSLPAANIRESQGSKFEIDVPVSVSTTDASQIDPQRLSEAVRSAVIGELVQQQRPGGALYNS